MEMILSIIWKLCLSAMVIWALVLWIYPPKK